MNLQSTDTTSFTERCTQKNGRIFLLFWLLTFALYLPDLKAGWVLDAAGWLYHVRRETFSDYINNTYSEIHSLYQFTEIITYVFYKLWGANVYVWSLLFITLHAVNCLLLFIVCGNIFSDSGIRKGKMIALFGILLFIICPHTSEVVIWKASYHYLQGFLLLLSILYCVQKYQYNQEQKYAWIAVLLFSVSVFSMEVFYVTPLFVLTLTMYYRYALGYGKAAIKKTITAIFIPQVIIFGGYLLLFYHTYHAFTPHVNNFFTQTLTDYLSKPPKYLFHLLILGRFFPFAAKVKLYAFCDSIGFLTVFYGIVAIVFAYLLVRFKKAGVIQKALLLLLSWIAFTLAILMPLAFPDAALLVFFDRYTYFSSVFVYMALVLLGSYIPNRYLAYSLLIAYGFINLFFTLKLNMYWKHSAYINNRLLHDLPTPGNKTVILLNLPECMNGVPMLDAQDNDNYKRLRGIFVDTSIPNKIYDAAAYNMVTPKDGAHATVINDSTVNVTLNQWGNWWWYNGHGALNYETPDYKINFVDGGHWYELILKHPASGYMLLYQTGDQWKIVDMSKVKQDQY